MREEHDIEELREIIELISDKVPALLNSLTEVLYGKASAEKYGQAASSFYKTLKESGMSDKQAFKLTEQYMSSLNLGKIIEGTVGRERRREGRAGPGKHKVKVDVSRHPHD